MKAEEIINALQARSDDKIWAKELALFGGTRRVDFWTLEPAASKGFRATAYEVKVSRADFKADSLEKQSKAISYSDRFFYITPKDLLDKKEIPEWAGLMEWDGESFSVKKRAPKLAKKEPDWDFVVSLMRNSGDSRRDVSLLHMQLAWQKIAIGAFERANESKLKRNRDKWEKRSKSELFDDGVGIFGKVEKL